MLKFATPPARLAILVATGGLFLTGAAGAGPQITLGNPDQTLEAKGNYSLICWQEGQKIIDETGKEGLSGIELRDAPGLNIAHTDGSRRIVFTTGENLCIVDFGEGPSR